MPETPGDAQPVDDAARHHTTVVGLLTQRCGAAPSIALRGVGAVDATWGHAPASVRVGRYQVRHLLGEGGMGQVLRARDPEIGRDVAIKVIRGAADAHALTKFAIEGQVTGQLEHPGIVPLHEMGVTDDGRLYFAMKCVDGRTLAEIAAEPFDPAELVRRLRVVMQICEALEFAHSRGVIHRDLKPANVMVGAFGETLVMDWGLAKVVGTDDLARDAVRVDLDAVGFGDEGEDLRTLDGAIVGTPAYMPPEQAAGRVDELDARSDVYSLGAILYELLAGQAPFDGASAWVVIERVAAGALEPPSARALDGRAVPRELDAVVMKAMAFEPSARYPSAAAMAEDVQAFLAGQALSAARYTAAQRLRKWAGRNRAVVGAAVVGLVALLVAAGGFRLREMRRADAARTEARARAASVLRALPHTLARLRAELSAAPRARETLDERALMTAKAGWRRALPAYMRAHDAVQAARLLDPGDPALARRHADVGEALACVAALAGDLGTAQIAAGRLARQVGQGDRIGRLREGLAALDRARLARRQRTLARQREQLDELLTEVGEAAGDHLDRRREELLVQVTGFEAQASVVPLAALLDELTARAVAARERGEPRGWTVVDERKALFACRALGQLGQLGRPGGAPALARFLAVVTDESQAIEAAIALCRCGRADAWPALRAARRRLSMRGFWTHVEPYTRRLPAETGSGSAIAARGEADALRQRGLDLIGRREFRQALRVLDRSLALDPRDAETWNTRGTARAELDQLTAAASDFREAIARSPNQPHYHVNLGNVLARQKRLDEAIAVFGRAIAVDGSHANAWAMRATARLQRGEPAEALADADRAIELQPASAEHHRIRANCLYAAGKLKAALASFDEAVRRAPKDPAGYLLRGRCLQRLGAFDRARADFDRTVALAPTWGEVYLMRAHLRYMRDDRDGALSDLAEALRLTPGEPRAHLLRGEMHLDAGEHEQALGELRRAVARSHAAIARAWLRLGEALMLLGRHHESLEALDRVRDLGVRALGRPAKQARYYQVRGLVLRHLGRPKEARVALDAAVRLAPRSGKALVERASLRRRQGDAAGALADLDRAIALGFRAARVHLERGLCQHALGNRRQALADLETARRAAPSDPDVYYHRAWVCLQPPADLGQAEADLGRVFALKPGRSLRARAHQLRARWHLQRRDGRSAVGDMETAIRLGLATADAYFDLGVARHAAQDRAGALAAYRKCLEVYPRHMGALVNGGQVHGELGQHREGEALLARAVELGPKVWDARWAHGLSLLRLGRKAEAFAELDRAVALCPPARKAALQAMRARIRQQFGG